MAQSKGLELRVHSQPVPSLLLDSGKVKQILTNLIGNAVKFTKNGFIEVEAKYGNSDLTITVSDTGSGISEDAQNLIFEPFFQVGDNSSAYTKGTGVGLVIAKRLTERMNGSLSISSKVGEGSKFTLVLREVKAAKISEKKSAADSDGANPLGGGRAFRVLIVDDSPVNLKVLGAILKNLGVEFRTALSGGSGVRLWPLSNGVRSKQFLELLPSPNGGVESMAQRISRQIAESGLNASITVSTNRIQRDNIEDQIGSTVDNIVVEPERRDTFPAIALAAAFLLFEKNASPDDVVAVLPIDPFTESDYFAKIAEAVEVVRSGAADLALLGVEPHCASSKFGYIVPQTTDRGETFRMVSHFEEKPQKEKAEQLIENGALWNAGVFVFRLGYVKKIAEKYVQAKSFENFRNKYAQLPKISFDYEVVEKAESVAVVCIL